jgi:ribosomal protein S17E
MSETEKMQADATEFAKKIARELMAEQRKLFQEEMNKMKDEMSKMKDELSKKVENAISGKDDEAKDNASDIGAAQVNGLGKGIYLSTSFDYVQLIKGPPMHFPTINHGKPPHFDGTRYTDWAYKMKMHLIAARLWEVVEVGVFIPTNEDREITPEEALNLHQNAQVISFLVSILSPDEFKKVNGTENAKVVWDTL